METGANPSDSGDHVELLREIFAAQRENRWSVGSSSARQRREKLSRLRDTILARRDELFEALSADLGKSSTESEFTELQTTLLELNEAIRHVGRWMRPVRVPTPLLLLGARSEIRYEPRGLVLIISTWNYPFYLAVAPAVGAIAAGNCVVIKPAEKTPATSRFVKRLFEDLFDPAEVSVVEGGPELGGALLDLPFNHFFFIGGAATGRKVMAAAARHLASVTLELGGKSPAIVDTTANLAAAAEEIVFGKFLNGGQTCVAPDYVFVHSSVEAELVTLLRAKVLQLYGESSIGKGDLARVVDRQAFHRLRTMLERAEAEGARIVVGGRSDEEALSIDPVVISNIDEGSCLMSDEIFGPLLPVMTWTDEEELVRRLRSGPAPLAMYPFSRDAGLCDRLIAKVPAGGVAVNTTTVQLANPALPFGGVGESGVGHYHGESGFRCFSHAKSVLVQKRRGLLRLYYPPFTSRVRRMVRLGTRYLSWIRAK